MLSPLLCPGPDVNVVEDDMFVTVVDELVTPLLTVKKNLFESRFISGM